MKRIINSNIFKVIIISFILASLIIVPNIIAIDIRPHRIDNIPMFNNNANINGFGISKLPYN